LLLAGLLALPAAGQTAVPANPMVRIGMSTRNIGNANHADVQAAMKVWLMTVTRDINLTVDPYLVVYDSPGAMQEALRQKQVDVITAGTDEFLAIEKAVPMSRTFAPVVHGRTTEQYVLLVARSRGFQGLADLRGQPLLVLDSPRNALAPLWLDTELMRSRLPPCARFFGKVTHATKLNLAILPVFFKQAGAALVSRNGFETAGELNPQLTRELYALAVSPELIPSLTSYRLDGNPLVVENYQKQAGRLGGTPAGKLILDLFQIDGIVEIKDADLAPTRAFLAEYARLKAEAERKGVPR
jgi:ABC-type phosphate/phosphonate transport system substrate-binding protein